jgi:hypothetical protein
VKNTLYFPKIFSAWSTFEKSCNSVVAEFMLRPRMAFGTNAFPLALQELIDNGYAKATLRARNPDSVAGTADIVATFGAM